MNFLKNYLSITFLVFMATLLIIYANPLLSLIVVIGGGVLVGKESKPAYGVVTGILIFLSAFAINEGGSAINDFLNFKEEHVVGGIITSAIIALPLTAWLLSFWGKKNN